jgi:integrase
MPKQAAQLSKVGKMMEQPESRRRGSPNQRKYDELRSREHLLPEEVEAMISAIKKAKGRYAQRDALLLQVMYRHGLRTAEVATLRWEQIDFTRAMLHVRRVKRGTPATHPIQGDTLRSLRELQRKYPDSAFVFTSSRRSPLAPDSIRGIVEKAGELAELSFPVHAHMLRHGCGYYLALQNTDTRTIQAYLGHTNIQHTVRYTQLSPEPFKGLWKK